MQVIIYADQSTPQPSRLQVVYPANDTLEEYAFKYLDPYAIEYLTVDYSVIPNASYFYSLQTLEIVDGVPQFAVDFEAAKEMTVAMNSAYWQQQYNNGIATTGLTNDYQLQLALATPEDERTAVQTAAVEFMIGLNGLQQSVQDQIDAATTVEELIQILDQLG